jgi:hypothetical protein
VKTQILIKINNTGLGYMANILFMDFELNMPLTYLNKFTKLLKTDNWYLDMFWAKDYMKKKRPTLDEKIKSYNILLIRKPMTFLSSKVAVEKIQKAILRDNKRLLLMLTFLDYETLDMLKDFLEPFNIIPTEIRAIDYKTNQDNRKSVIYHKKNKCFNHDELFKNVSKIVIPDATHLYVEPPAKILIRGNPSTEPFYTTGNIKNAPSGSDLIVGAYYEESGRMLIVNSTVFLDNYFDFNRPFIKNVIKWLTTGLSN